METSVLHAGQASSAFEVGTLPGNGEAGPEGSGDAADVCEFSEVLRAREERRNDLAMKVMQIVPPKTTREAGQLGSS